MTVSELKKEISASLSKFEKDNDCIVTDIEVVNTYYIHLSFLSREIRLKIS